MNLEFMGVTPLSKKEAAIVDGGGIRGFIGRAAAGVLLTTLGTALIVGVVAGYVGYKIYEYYNSDTD